MYSSLNLKIRKLFKKESNDLPFKPGMIASIKHDMCRDSVLSLVQETDENYLYLAYPREFRSYDVQLGDRISCRIKNIDCEYLIESNINNINMIYPSYIRIFVDNMVRFDNKRETKRYNINFDANISVFNEQNAIICNDVRMYVTDISLSGLYAIIPKKSIESLLDNYGMNVRLNAGFDSPVKFDAEIVRVVKKEYSNEIGIKIKYIDSDNIRSLERVVKKLENENASSLMKYLVRSERIKVSD
ncbi:MAG: PilZ domain-containing protein [Bacillota bacterium]|nr:PilZ domain-containing protein [Bacillota bacterium]